MSPPESNRPRVDLAALHRRDPAAVEAWFREHADAVYAFACRRVGRDRASDVVQDTFLASLERIGEFDPRRGSMLPWLLFQARNAMRTSLRRAGRQVDVADSGDGDAVSALARLRGLADDPLPEEVVERAESGAYVRAAFDRLPEDYRKALVSHHVHERRLDDLAREHGITESAARSLVHRARLAFRDALEQLLPPEYRPTGRRTSP